MQVFKYIDSFRIIQLDIGLKLLSLTYCRKYKAPSDIRIH